MFTIAVVVMKNMDFIVLTHQLYSDRLHHNHLCTFAMDQKCWQLIYGRYCVENHKMVDYMIVPMPQQCLQVHQYPFHQANSLFYHFSRGNFGIFFILTNFTLFTIIEVFNSHRSSSLYRWHQIYELATFPCLLLQH